MARVGEGGGDNKSAAYSVVRQVDELHDRFLAVEQDWNRNLHTVVYNRERSK